MLLPKAYRAERGEELLAVLMDKSGPRQQWPTIGEVFSLAGLGIRVRFGAEHQSASATGRAEVVRIVALLSVLLMAMNGTIAAALMLRLNAHFGVRGSMAGLSWRHVLGTYAGVGWLFAYVALVAGMRRTGRTLCVVLFVITAIMVVNTSPYAYGPLPRTRFYDLAPYTLATAAVVLSFRRGATPVRHSRRWLAALVPTAVFGIAGIADVLPAIVHRAAPVTGIEVMSAMLVTAALAVCVQAWTSPVWPVAAAVAILGCFSPVLVEAATDPYFSLGPVGVAAAAMSVGFFGLAVLSAGKQRLVPRGLPSRQG